MATVTAWKQAHRCTVSHAWLPAPQRAKHPQALRARGFGQGAKLRLRLRGGASAHAAARRPDRSHIPDTINNRPDFPDLISGKSGRFSVMPHRKGGSDRGLKHAAPNTRRPGGVRAASGRRVYTAVNRASWCRSGRPAPVPASQGQQRPLRPRPWRRQSAVTCC